MISMYTIQSRGLVLLRKLYYAVTQVIHFFQTSKSFCIHIDMVTESFVVEVTDYGVYRLKHFVQ